LGKYNFTLFSASKEVKSVEIDPSQLMADIERENNVFVKEEIKIKS